MAASSSSSILQFFMLIGRLKGVKRTGWVRRQVREPESVAGHMYRMSVMAFLADNQSSLNKDKCIKLSVVHDMAECIVGDLAPSDGVSKEEKHRRELAAMDHLQKLLPGQVATEVFQLWQEYETQSSPEAVFVKDLDRFDMVLQAYEYEQSDGRPGKLQEFFDSTNGKFQTPQVKDWLEELNRLRKTSLPSNTQGEDS